MLRTYLLFGGLVLSFVVGCGDEQPSAEDNSPETAASNNPPGTAAQNPDEKSSDATDSDMSLGMAAFEKGMCSKCHMADGSGGERGPSLIDDVWDHCDGSVDGIRQVLESGVAKEDLKDPSRPFGMNPATNLVSDPAELAALAEYVKSLSQ